MNFSKTTFYALNILSFMAKNDDFRMSANYLHQKLNLPYSYIRSVMLSLAKNNIINSINGRNGGFILSRDKPQIFLSEIIDVTEGLESFNKCIMGFDKCPFNYGCYMHPIWTRMRDEILNVFRNTSLADLLIAEIDIKYNNYHI